MRFDPFPLYDPAAIFATFHAQHPGAIEMALECHNWAGYGDMSWPWHVFVPSRLVEASLLVHYGYAESQPNAEVKAAIGLEASLATALAAWSVQPVVFAPDGELVEAYHRAPPSTAIPVGALRNLPASCVYVELPHAWRLGQHKILGAFAHLDTTEHGEDEHLQIYWNTGHELLQCPLPLGGSINDGLSRLIKRAHAVLLEKGDQEAAEAVVTPGRIHEVIGPPELISGLVNTLAFLGAHGRPDDMVNVLDGLVA